MLEGTTLCPEEALCAVEVMDALKNSRQAMSDRKGCINTSQHPQPLGGAHARLALCAIFQFLQPKAAAFLVPQDLAKKKGTPLQVASSPSVLTFPLMLLTCLKGTT